MTIDLDAALEAVSDPTRRDILERIIVRPSRIVDLARSVTVTRPAVSHHVRILKDAGLVEEKNGRLCVVLDALPHLRSYFDRLWLEASLGDAWIVQRGLRMGDLGL